MCAKLTKINPEKNKEIELLVKQGLIVNLYAREKALLEQKSKKTKMNSIELNHLFIFPLKTCAGSYHDSESNFNKIITFLNNNLPVGYLENIFNPTYHIPAIGIYNSITNQLIGLGLGRKNRLLLLNAEGLIEKKAANYLKKMKQYDIMGRIDQIIKNLEELGSAHYNLEYTVEDWENLTTEQEELNTEIEMMIEALNEEIPTLSIDICDLSPFDF